MTRWEYLFRKTLDMLHRRVQAVEANNRRLERRIESVHAMLVLEFQSAQMRADNAEHNARVSFDRMVTMMGRKPNDGE